MKRLLWVLGVTAVAVTSTQLIDDDRSFDRLSTTDRPTASGDLPGDRSVEEEPPATGGTPGRPGGGRDGTTTDEDERAADRPVSGGRSGRPDPAVAPAPSGSGSDGDDVRSPGPTTGRDGAPPGGSGRTGTGTNTIGTSTSTSTSTSTTAPTPPLDPDQIQCPELASVAVGAWDPTAPDPTVLADAARRFRAMLPLLQAASDRSNRSVVCGNRLLRAWRGDVLIQGVTSGPRRLGVLMAGRAPADPVILLTDLEWRAWDWFRGESGEPINFTGTPLRRELLDGVPIIRTSTGAAVTPRPDAPSYSVVGGAWTYWLDHGGPSGPMGRPTTYPTYHGTDVAVQGFEHGTLRLRGVTNAYEAMAAPPTAFEWHSFEASPPRIAASPNSLVEYRGASYYVDRDLQRHWIETSSDWSCARHELGARNIGPIDVFSLAAIREGAVFRCPA